MIKLPVLLSARTRVIFFTLLFFYIITIFGYVLSSFDTNDPLPDVKTISIQMRKDFREFSSRIRTGIFINNFLEFDFVKNHFVIDAVVWFEFNPSELMLDTIEQFSFENSTMLYKSPPAIRRYGQKMLAKYHVKFSTKTSVDHHRFPLDDHRLSLILVNDTVTAEEMYFDDATKALSLSIDDDIFISNWQALSLQSISGYEPLPFDKHKHTRIVNVPKAAFTINFRKTGVNTILIILVPMFVAMFLSMFTCLMSFNSYMGKYSLSITAITALLGYRFVIDRMSPLVGYFTIADKLFLLFLLLSFFLFAFQIVIVRQYMFLAARNDLSRTERALSDLVNMTPRKTEHINTIVFYAVGILFAIIVTWLIM